MRKLVTASLLALAFDVALPAYAANERLFEFPGNAAGTCTGLSLCLVNALHVTGIAKGPPQANGIPVFLFSGSGSFVAFLPDDAAAQAFIDLWRQRVEDAR
jgi:hypothetical protein